MKTTTAGDYYERQREYSRTHKERRAKNKAPLPKLRVAKNPAMAARNRQWFLDHREQVLQYARDYYRKNKERQQAQTKENRIKKWLIYSGWSRAEYEERVARGCGVCGRHVKLVFDHDHNTQRLRGLLCTRCNVRLEWALEFAEEIGTYVAAAAV